MKFFFRASWFFILLLLQVTPVHSQTYVALAKEGSSKLFGYIDRDGNYFIEPQFAYSYSFCKEGFAPVFDNMNDKVYFINLEGDTVLKSCDRYNLITPQEGSIYVPNFIDGALLVEKDGKYGCVDTEGQLIAPVVYDKITAYDEGLAIGKRDDKSFIIDKMNNEILELDTKVDSVFSFSEGFARFISKDNKQGYINKNGEIVIEPQYLYAGRFVCGLARACYVEKQFGYIDTLGTWKIKPEYRTATDFSYADRIALVRTRASLTEGYVFTNGYFFVPDNGKNFGVFSEGLARAEYQGKFGFINMFGQWAIPASFDHNIFSPFSCGANSVQGNYFLGVIDKNGNWTVEPRFLQMGKFVEVDDGYLN